MCYDEMLEILRGKVLYESPAEIQQRLNEIADALEQLVRERDAAVADLKELADCDYCKYGKGDDCEDTLHDYCTVGEDWEWRGVQDEA